MSTEYLELILEDSLVWTLGMCVRHFLSEGEDVLFMHLLHCSNLLTMSCC